MKNVPNPRVDLWVLLAIIGSYLVAGYIGAYVGHYIFHSFFATSGETARMICFVGSCMVIFTIAILTLSRICDHFERKENDGQQPDPQPIKAIIPRSLRH